MTNPNIQIGDEVREMTADELKQWKADKTAAAAQAQVEADKQALKVATLTKLGLTADEVAALLS
jgi:hypothetical protein